MKLLGRIQCFVLRKHKRGVLVRTDPPETEGVRFKYFACPRCNFERRYKV